MAAGFDLDDFITKAREAARAADARARMKVLLADAVKEPGPVAGALPAFEAGEDGIVLFEDDTISIWHARFRVGAKVPAHDHGMSATIAVYQGAERNTMWRSDGYGGIEPSGEVVVRPGEVYQIGPSAIHSVTCASDIDCHGIHVYLGRLTTVKRSLYDVEAGEALPFTDENYKRLSAGT